MELSMKIRSLLRKTNMERRRKRRWIGHEKSLALPTSGKEKREDSHKINWQVTMTTKEHTSGALIRLPHKVNMKTFAWKGSRHMIRVYKHQTKADTDEIATMAGKQ